MSSQASPALSTYPTLVYPPESPSEWLDVDAHTGVGCNTSESISEQDHLCLVSPSWPPHHMSAPPGEDLSPLFLAPTNYFEENTAADMNNFLAFLGGFQEDVAHSSIPPTIPATLSTLPQGAQEPTPTVPQPLNPPLLPIPPSASADDSPFIWSSLVPRELLYDIPTPGPAPAPTPAPAPASPYAYPAVPLPNSITPLVSTRHPRVRHATREPYPSLVARRTVARRQTRSTHSPATSSSSSVSSSATSSPLSFTASVPSPSTSTSSLSSLSSSSPSLTSRKPTPPSKAPSHTRSNPCPHCPPSAPRTFSRAKDLDRHVASVHLRFAHAGPAPWVCCGLPVEDVTGASAGAGAGGRHAGNGEGEGGGHAGQGVHVYNGTLMVGGCGRECSRKDVLRLHLRRHACAGDVDGWWLPGNQH